MARELVSGRVFVSGAVEGFTDEVVLRRVVEYAGGHIGGIFGKKGKDRLDVRLAGYNNAARHAPWCVLRDMDDDAPCPAELKSRLLPEPAEFMRLRIVVRATEAWLMADRERLATFLSVPTSRIPFDPEGLADPKCALVDLASGSRRRDVRYDMVPGSKSGRKVGPAYAARIIEYALTSWRPHVAEDSSESLKKCVIRLKELTEGYLQS